MVEEMSCHRIGTAPIEVELCVGFRGDCVEDVVDLDVVVGDDFFESSQPSREPLFSDWLAATTPNEYMQPRNGFSLSTTCLIKHGD